MLERMGTNQVDMFEKALWRFSEGLFSEGLFSEGFSNAVTGFRALAREPESLKHWPGQTRPLSWLLHIHYRLA